MNTLQDKALAAFAAMNQAQLHRIRELVTDDFVDHGAPPGGDAYVQVLTWVTQVLKIRYEIHNVFASGDRVAIRAVAYGVHDAANFGVEPTGKPYRMDTAHIFRSERGMLAEHWGVRAELPVLFQVGALTPPPLRELAKDHV